MNIAELENCINYRFITFITSVSGRGSCSDHVTTNFWNPNARNRPPRRNDSQASRLFEASSIYLFCPLHRSVCSLTISISRSPRILYQGLQRIVGDCEGSVRLGRHILYLIAANSLAQNPSWHKRNEILAAIESA